jgi:hypothetical protein
MKMATKSKNEIAAVSNVNALGFSEEVPEWAKGGQGRGSENVGTKDIVIPRLELVQAQSPIKDENEDAKEGLMFNTVTQEVLGDTVFVIPVYYRMEYLVWKDQDAGGGFHGSYDHQDLADDQVRKLVAAGEDPDLLEVVDTPVHYCLRVAADMSLEQIVISMPKSKAKVSRKWNAMIQIAGGDRFSRVYKVTSFKDKNKQNKTFYNYVVQPAGFPPEALYREAEKQYAMFSGADGQVVRASHDAPGETTTAGHQTDSI